MLTKSLWPTRFPGLWLAISWVNRVSFPILCRIWSQNKIQRTGGKLVNQKMQTPCNLGENSTPWTIAQGPISYFVLLMSLPVAHFLTATHVSETNVHSIWLHLSTAVWCHSRILWPLCDVDVECSNFSSYSFPKLQKSKAVYKIVKAGLYSLFFPSLSTLNWLCNWDSITQSQTRQCRG